LTYGSFSTAAADAFGVVNADANAALHDGKVLAAEAALKAAAPGKPRTAAARQLAKTAADRERYYENLAKAQSRTAR
jgi:hypothetical protein